MHNPMIIVTLSVVAICITLLLVINSNERQVEGSVVSTPTAIPLRGQITGGIKPADQQAMPGVSKSAITFPPNLQQTRTEAPIQEAVKVDEQILQDTEDKMSELIRKYNENLSHRKKRQGIEGEAALVTKGYKQQVLAKVKQLLEEEQDIEQD